MIEQTYILDESSISISGVSHQLLPIEITILSLFSKNRNVLNSSLMELFAKDDKTKDYAVKRKIKLLLRLIVNSLSCLKLILLKKKSPKAIQDN